jgi:hypothetical protein
MPADVIGNFGYIGLVIFLILGILVAFFGKRIMETIAFVIGAMVGASLALMVVQYEGVQTLITDNNLDPNICLVIAVIVGALIGGFLGRSFMYGLISMIVASTVSYVAFVLTGNEILSLIVFFVALVIMWFVVEKFLMVITAFMGACMVGLSVMLLTFESMGTISIVFFIIIAALLTIAGARYQMQKE